MTREGALAMMEGQQTVISKSDDQLVIVTYDEAVAILTLNQPRAINALSQDMLESLHAILDEIADNKAVRAVILRSSSKHFCAGHNLKEMTARRSDKDGGKAYFIELFAICSSLMKRIVSLPQPVIAEVRGIATAAGCQLVAACDLAVASQTARFATSGVNIGLFCSTPMVALSRNLSRKQSMEMLLLGDFIDAARVHEMGLVNHVVADEELEAHSLQMAKVIASKSSSAVKIGKEAFYKQLEMPLAQAYAYAGEVMATNMMFKDAEAGIGAFIDKKHMPDWTGD